jgi:plastocyanin
VTLDRRTLLILGGGIAASLLVRPALGADAVEIEMAGTSNGSRVWFNPVGILVAPGTTIRWTNKDRGNAHTATSFKDRIPEGAEPWDSKFLLPDKTFELTLEVPGVYDYYCIPHLHAGMVGRILVGNASTAFADYDPGTLKQNVLDRLPAIADIVAAGSVDGTQ